jgi:hypothetical protein
MSASRGSTSGCEAINQRFDDMRDLWCTEVRRVEVLDARLKHLEERS